MNNDSVLLGIVDLHAVLHIAKYGAISRGIGMHEENTFLIHSFFYKFRHICSKLTGAHIVFACDSLTNKRKLIYPDYKYKRDTKTEDQIYIDNISYPQFTLIKTHVLPRLGYRNIIEFEGYEADDVIAAICKTYPKNNKIIVTEDKDLYQLLANNTAILSPKNCTYYSIEDFQNDYKITPDKWVDVKTYGGCSSDNIPGICNITASGRVSQKGFGEKTALKYVRGDLGKNSTLRLSVQDERNREIISRNRKLVTLPYEGTPNVKIRANKLSYSGFLDIVEEYNFHTIGEDALAFKHILRLK